MKTDIIVVGGYGHVGGKICNQLAIQYPGKVYAAGRSLAKAEQFCRSGGGMVKPLRISVEEPLEKQQLERVKLVVMCLDQMDTAFAEACLLAGADYVDVSANGAFFAAMEQLNKSMNDLKGTAVLSVGLAPGLTNLLALKAVLSMDEVLRIDVGIMLGLRDAHGKAAIEWTVDSLTRSFYITESDCTRRVSSFTEGIKTDFGADLGVRTAYRFPFSDQETLPHTLGVPTVSTRLCFDSRIVTSTIALIKGIGIDRLLRLKTMRRLAIQVLGGLRIGSARYAVKVTGYGSKVGVAAKMEYGLQGTEEAEITAQTAIAVAKAVYSANLPKGIYHIEQLFELDVYETQLMLRLKEDESKHSYSTISNIECWTRTNN
jgi:saccharopine dehydrogenase (NAD+, L-lysine-forming)